MIERHWKGIAKKERENEYIAHLQNETFKKIASNVGFISAKILKREVEDGVEFMIITKWENLDAIKNFTGFKIDNAVVPELVRDIMVRYDNTVSHYETYYETKTE